MSKNLTPLTDQELEQANGGKIETVIADSMKDSSCRNFRTKDQCKEQSDKCQWEDGLCVPADGLQPGTTRIKL